MADNKNANPLKVITGLVRLSFLNVWEPWEKDDGKEPRYSASILVPKTDAKTIGDIEKAVQAAIDDGKNSQWGGKIPANLHRPLYDGAAKFQEDEKKYSGYKDCMYLNAYAKLQPSVVDSNVRPILDREALYSGCWGRVSLSFYPYKNKEGGVGVGVGLNHIQKIKDDARFDGRTSAEDDFTVYDEEGLLD